jgi:hypothetical protein
LAAGIVVGAAVAGCGQTSSGRVGAGRIGSARVTSTSLCADQATVSKVQVAHIPGIAQLDPGKPGQNRVFTITIANPAKARELARAICALPPVRNFAVRCPTNVGGGYHLMFTALSRRLPVVTIEATGCQRVTGTSNVRAASPRFWTAFSQATGIRAPAHGR